MSALIPFLKVKLNSNVDIKKSRFATPDFYNKKC